MSSGQVFLYGSHFTKNIPYSQDHNYLPDSELMMRNLFI